MNYIKYSFALVIIFCLNVTVFAVTQQEMATIINLAGKQRMLSQKMSKEIMLIGRGVHVADNEINLRETAELFEQTIKGLIHGDAKLGLVKIDDHAIMKQLEKVEKLWWRFQRSVIVVLKGTAPLHVLRAIALQNMPLLEEMNKAVQMYEKNNASKLSPAMAITINLAGKQRMLTQKMTKELMLVANRIHTYKNKAKVKASAALFDRTLNGLLNGDKELGLFATKNVAIHAQLNIVKMLWIEYKPIVDNVDISWTALDKAEQINMPLLIEMNKVVQMYTNSVK